MTTGEVVEDEINPHPGMLKVMIQLMKLRVILTGDCNLCNIGS